MKIGGKLKEELMNKETRSAEVKAVLAMTSDDIYLLYTSVSAKSWVVPLKLVVCRNGYSDLIWVTA